MDKSPILGINDLSRKCLKTTGVAEKRKTIILTSDEAEEEDCKRQERPRKLRRRHKIRCQTSSSDSGESIKTHSKSRCGKFSKGRTSSIFDKFLNIIKEVQNFFFRNSEKPQISYNNNVIPDFDPMTKEQTILTWINKVEECAEIYNWDEKEIIHYSLPKLWGMAKSWYQGLPTMLYSWSEWKKKLIESFPSRENYADILMDMLFKRVKYGESL